MREQISRIGIEIRAGLHTGRSSVRSSRCVEGGHVTPEEVVDAFYAALFAGDHEGAVAMYA